MTPDNNHAERVAIMKREQERMDAEWESHQKDRWQEGYRTGMVYGVTIGLLIPCAVGALYLLLYVPWVLRH